MITIMVLPSSDYRGCERNPASAHQRKFLFVLRLLGSIPSLSRLFWGDDAKVGMFPLILTVLHRDGRGQGVL